MIRVCPCQTLYIVAQEFLEFIVVGKNLPERTDGLQTSIGTARHWQKSIIFPTCS